NVDSKNIRAESIETRNLKANSITTDKINAGAVIAEKIDVKELSAISANLGHIVAGLIESIEIYGSYIATSRGSFPRCEMSNTENMFAAYGGNGRSIKMVAHGDVGSPILSFVDNQGMTVIRYSNSTFYIDAPSGTDIFISGGNIELSPYGRVYVKNWDSVYSRDDRESLRDALNK
ncbi:hypothetical protein, partial [Paenibacillus dendritiformis]